MTISDILFGLFGGGALVFALRAAYWFGRADGIEEADRRRFWTDRGEKP